MVNNEYITLTPFLYMQINVAWYICCENVIDAGLSAGAYFKKKTGFGGMQQTSYVVSERNKTMRDILKGRWPRFQARPPPISFLTIAGRAAANPPPSI